MALALFSIQRAAPKQKPYKLPDGNGLYLLVKPSGKKLWRFRYSFAGKENMLALGSYPEISLASARAKRDEARRLVAEGIDPAQRKKLDKLAAKAAASNTFGAVAAEYLEKLQVEGKAEATIEKNRWLLEDLASSLSRRPIADISPAEILDLLKRIEKTGRRHTARRLRGTLGTVFRYGIVTLRNANDPTFALRGALLTPVVTHRAAITDEQEFGALMRTIDDYDGWPTLRAALQFLALTMARPGDVRHMRRSEVVFPKALWRIPAERMKMRRPHDVPLSKQALSVLRGVWDMSGGELVFSSIRSNLRPLSENAMNSALRRMGYTKDEVTAHGFRSSASTILNEQGFSPDVIEAALAHQDEDDVRRAYNRATYLPERTKLMQDWANLIDQLKKQPGKTRRVA
jgi:integrase